MSSRKFTESVGSYSISRPNLFSIQPSICDFSSSLVIPSVYSSSDGLSSVKEVLEISVNFYLDRCASK